MGGCCGLCVVRFTYTRSIIGMKSEKIQMNLPHDVDKISCDFCTQAYIVWVVFTSSDIYGEGPNHSFMTQEDVCFCPYCGEKSRGLDSSGRKC